MKKPQSPRVRQKKISAKVDLTSLPIQRPQFVETMQCKLVAELSTGPDWVYELKYDGYRALVLKDGKNIKLISRNEKPLNSRYPEIVKAIADLPFESGVLDGEIVVLDENGLPSFQRLQDLSVRDKNRSLYFYAFDLLNFQKRDLRRLPLLQRKQLLLSLLPRGSTIRYAAHMEVERDLFVQEVRKMGLEGVVGKRKSSLYESGKRTGAWEKLKLDLEQEFVVGGFRPSGVRDSFDLLLIGYYEGKDLFYAAKLRAGFTPHSKKEVASRFPKLVTEKCPFTELPVGKGGRWGEGLTPEDIERTIWLKPRIVVRAQFVEWTTNGHLRHVKFVALRDDKNPREVVREGNHENPPG